MQQVLVDMAVLGLIVFLFVEMSRRRRDARLWLWTGGWLSIVAHFAIELWSPAGGAAQVVQACLSVDALLLAASCFIYSHALLRVPARLSHGAAVTLIPSTLLVVDLAISGWCSPKTLALLVVGRQAVAIACILGSRRYLRFTRVSVFNALLIGGWMIAALMRGRPDIVVDGLLCEVYLSTALNFYGYGWRRSVAVKTIIAGLMAWAAVFPIAVFVGEVWPQISVNPEVWNVPKFFVAIGMILAVIEEDTRAARALGEDYRLLFDHNPQPFWIVEIETLRFMAVNDAGLELHGYTREEFLELKLTDVLAPEDRIGAADVVHSDEERLLRGRRHLRKDGSSVFIDVRVQEIRFRNLHCRFALGIDVTEREELQRKLEHQATHDSLTGLPNRMLLLDFLGNAVGRAMGCCEKLAVLTIDIDRLKRVNDIYGLRIGDACIEQIARTLVTRTGPLDMIARTGGDEFTIVMTGLKGSAAAKEQVRELLKEFRDPIVVQGYKIHVPVSVGVAIGPDDGTDPIALWRGSESALGEAKAAGGEAVIWLSAELKSAEEEQLQIEAHLRTKMNDGSLHLMYQPIYGADGTIKSMEALLRLRHPKFGDVSPGRLIPIAEAAGLIVQLGEWVIEEVCRQLIIWGAEDCELVPVAVNISGLQIMHQEFAPRMMAILQGYEIDPRLLHLEITESVALRNLEAVSETVAALSRLGIQFSIDDFGTGHSSLARLGQLGASILKIDRSFLRRDCPPNSYSIVKAIVTMAHALGHLAVAEGVENAEQLRCLRNLQCDFYQGYLLSQPVPPEQIPALLGVVHGAFQALEMCPGGAPATENVAVERHARALSGS